SGEVIRTVGAIAYTPVEISATTNYLGIYAIDTLDLTDRLFLTVSGRFNLARVGTTDRTGVSPDLTGRHRFQRFNPAAGLAYRLPAGVTAYGGYTEANRAPTPLELACSDPLRPCLLENALVADPPLRQVVARTWQAGLRRARVRGLDWSLGLFQAENRDDVVALASAIQGRGYYANVPRTRRRGLEAAIDWRSDRWLAYASASDVQATYQFTGALPSPNSPFADAAGDIHITPGARIGGIPELRGKAGADFTAATGLTVGADLLAVGAQRLVGDEAGKDARLAGYWLAGVHASWTLGRGVELFGRIDNLFNRRYATFGTYFEADGLASLKPSPLPADPDPRTITPGPPRAVQIGLRARW
ncbi:MAG TPA: TonB-dependent receptor, partial [Phenylobacterium sp.]|nr:TonB-dependent receptor [Phenylobacterium sp.]